MDAEERADLVRRGALAAFARVRLDEHPKVQEWLDDAVRDALAAAERDASPAALPVASSGALR